MNMKKNYLIITILFVFGINSYSQVIQTSPLPASVFCAGQSINVTYTSQGQFQNDNMFIVQLSNNNFQNFLNIGYNAYFSGNITANIPIDFQQSSSCRIRVISTNPYVEGSDNGSDFTVYNKYSPKANINIDKYSGHLDSLFYFNLSFDTTTNIIVKWNFGEGADPSEYSGEKPPPIRYASTGMKSISCVASSDIPCSDTVVRTENIYVYNCDLALNSDALVDSIGIDLSDFKDSVIKAPEYAQLWLMPGTSHNIARSRMVHILETGSNLKLSEVHFSVFYLKPGSSVSIIYPMFCAFIKSPGSSISIPDSGYNQVYNCSSIKIKYNAAPMGGVQYMVSRGYLDVGENQATTNDFCISPNPATDFIEISSLVGAQHAVPLQIRIYNVFGEEQMTDVLHLEDLGHLIKLNVSSLSPGLYFVRANNKMQKFIKL